ncbi:laccase domain-containing protein [Patescibacteria group bacterium]|nr:laccase domain-containing protein [Patescibacteria group bacterium]
MVKPVHSHLLGEMLKITVWGKTPKITNHEGQQFAAERFKKRLPPLILAAPIGSGEGAFTVVDKRSESLHHPSLVRADAVLAPANCAVGMTTRDCLVAVLLHPHAHTMAIVHCGREQLRGILDKNILLRTLYMLASSRRERCDVLVHLTAGISGKHFLHEKNLNSVREFPRMYGWAVLHGKSHRGALKLDILVRRMLEQNGVPRRNITHDGLCTYDNKALGSKRAEDAGEADKELPNLTLVSPYTLDLV